VTTELFVGIDIGTSGLKAIALDAAGVKRAAAAHPYVTYRPTPGAAEQLTEHWVGALYEALGELTSSVRPDRISAIGLAGMVPTLVTLDWRKTPNGPAVTWEDKRAEQVGAKLRDSAGAERCYEVTGQCIDGRYMVPMYLRLCSAEPSRAVATHSLCSAKDYLFLQLTGELATDPSTAAASGCYALANNDYDAHLLKVAATLAGGTLPALPPVRPSTTSRPMIPQLAESLGLSDVAVCLGAADSVAGSLGVGALGRGEVAYLGGTSTVILATTDAPLRDPKHRFLVTPTTLEVRWGLEMDLLSTGSAVSWVAGMLAETRSERAVIELASIVEPSDAPVFLPYLAPGEQGALWDPSLAGVILDLELRHGAAHLSRALLNGILLESRRCVKVLDDARQSTQVLVAGGWPTNSPAFCQDLADATGCSVASVGGGKGGAAARGAAMLAATSQGVELRADRAGRFYHPRSGQQALWEELWCRHEGALRAASMYYRAARAATARACDETGDVRSCAQ
jgi:xylulokinase